MFFYILLHSLSGISHCCRCFINHFIILLKKCALPFTGYSGLNCQEERSDCRNDTCPERAMCKDEPGINNFTCLCRSGYTGLDCDITVSILKIKSNTVYKFSVIDIIYNFIVIFHSAYERTSISKFDNCKRAGNQYLILILFLFFFL